MIFGVFVGFGWLDRNDRRSTATAWLQAMESASVQECHTFDEEPQERAWYRRGGSPASANMRSARLLLAHVSGTCARRRIRHVQITDVFVGGDVLKRGHWPDHCRAWAANHVNIDVLIP